MKSENTTNDSEKYFLNRKNEIEKEIVKFKKQSKHFLILAWTIVGAGLILFIWSIFYYYNLKSSNSGFTLNLLGDFHAGTIASLWAFAGILFIYVAFLGQKQQLALQQIDLLHNQHELELTRIELKGQKENFKEQNITLKKQRFENTFFQLLKNHQDIVTGFKSNSHNGREIFNPIFNTMRSSYSTAFNVIEDQQRSFKGAIDSYLNVYNNYQNFLGHYFRNLYQIFKFIDKSPDFDYKEKYVYSSLVRAILSNHELVLLTYNCLSKNGVTKFKPLVERYTLLKNINTEKLLDKSHLKKFKELAYANSEKRLELISYMDPEEFKSPII